MEKLCWKYSEIHNQTNNDIVRDHPGLFRRTENSKLVSLIIRISALSIQFYKVQRCKKAELILLIKYSNEWTKQVNLCQTYVDVVLEGVGLRMASIRSCSLFHCFLSIFFTGLVTIGCEEGGATRCCPDEVGRDDVGRDAENICSRCRCLLRSLSMSDLCCSSGSGWNWNDLRIIGRHMG